MKQFRRHGRRFHRMAGVGVSFLALGVALTGSEWVASDNLAAGMQPPTANKVRASEPAFVLPALAQRRAVSRWGRAVNLYPGATKSYSSPEARATLREIRAMGANRVVFVVPLVQNGKSAVKIGRGADTPSDLSIKRGVRYARSIGLAPALSINSNDSSKAKTWRAEFVPTSHRAWFASYRRWLTHYADIARSNQVTDMVIATEMISLTKRSVDQKSWSGLIGAVRGRYKGRVTYDANHGDEVSNVRFWNQLDYISISAYYSFGSNEGKGMLGRWKDIDERQLAPVAKRYKKKIFFGEVGYCSGNAARAKPWDPNCKNGFNEQEQIDDYAALLSYWSKRPYFAGMSIWRFYVDLGRDWIESAASFTTQTTDTQVLLTRWFTGKFPSTWLSVDSPAQGQPVAPLQPVLVRLNGKVPSGGTISMSVDDAAPSTLSMVSETEWTGQLDTTKWPRSHRNGLHAVQFVLRDAVGKVLTRRTSLVYEATIDSANSFPSPGATLRGSSTFQASLAHVPAADYSMAWAVNGGEANLMKTKNGGPLKTSDANVSEWLNWAPDGKVLLQFSARARDGGVVAIESIPVTVESN
jgi:hypothetical protein